MNTLKTIEYKVHNFTTSRLMCVLSDPFRKIPKKYMIMDYINGRDLSNFGQILSEMDKEEKKNEILRFFFFFLFIYLFFKFYFLE